MCYKFSFKIKLFKAVYIYYLLCTRWSPNSDMEYRITSWDVEVGEKPRSRLRNTTSSLNQSKSLTISSKWAP